MRCSAEWPLDTCCYNSGMHKNYLLSPLIVVLFLVASTHAQTNARPPSVPDINGMAITLVKPAFPVDAAVGEADGSAITLLVTVDEIGNVISAQCSLNCHPLLKDAAELAASTSTFRPLLINGKAVKYEGILLYTFVVERVNWYRFGTSFESVRQFDNLSLGPAAQILSVRFAEERSRLLALDEKGVELETRWKVMREVEGSLKTKLKENDLWRFEIGMALRLVTFWTMAGERTNRTDLQNAIDALPKLIASAPSDIPETTREALKTVAKYRVPVDLPERELRQTINNMTRNIRLE